jgi:hypothetical protein
MTVTAVLAGCATQPAATAGPHRTATLGGSRAEALAEGSRMLRAVTLPAGSRRLSGRPLPPALQDLPFSVRGSVDPYVVYRLPVAMRTAAQYMQAHLPADLVSGGISEASRVNGPTIMLTVTSDLQHPPAGIAQLQLYENLVPGPGGSSLLLADALVTWFPPRSGLEDLTANRFRLIRITAQPIQGAAVTVTSDSRAVVAFADALNRLPAVPGGLWHSCPPIVINYRLTLVPAVRGQPVVVVDANSCEADAVTVGGRAQPRLEDITNSVYRLAAAVVRQSHH